MLDKLKAIFTERTDSLRRASSVDTTKKSTPSKPVQMTSGQKTENLSEIKYGKEISDTQIEREKYISPLTFIFSPFVFLYLHQQSLHIRP